MSDFNTKLGDVHISSKKSRNEQQYQVCSQRNCAKNLSSSVSKIMSTFLILTLNIEGRTHIIPRNGTRNTIDIFFYENHRLEYLPDISNHKLVKCEIKICFCQQKKMVK